MLEAIGRAQAAGPLRQVIAPILRLRVRPAPAAT
jgi:hypothetical protein